MDASALAEAKIEPQQLELFRGHVASEEEAHTCVALAALGSDPPQGG